MTEKNVCLLCCMPLGKSCKVAQLLAQGKQRRRMLDLGLVEGTTVCPLQKGPSGDPVAYSIRGAVIALRKEDAGKIIVCYQQ